MMHVDAIVFVDKPLQTASNALKTGLFISTLCYILDYVEANHLSIL